VTIISEREEDLFQEQIKRKDIQDQVFTPWLHTRAVENVCYLRWRTGKKTKKIYHLI
jgi:hypothetical protein